MKKSKKIALVVRDVNAKSDKRISASHSWEIMTAHHVQANLKSDPKIREALFRDVETGAHYNFVQDHWRNGRRKVDAHFAYAAGHAPEVDHFFDANEPRYKNIKEALADDAKIILSLNLDLSYKDLDFSKTQDSDIQELDVWKSNNNYHSVSVRDIDEAISVIHQVARLGGNPQRDIVASSRNGVMPYNRFYLGNRQNDFEKLYDGMVAGDYGTSYGSTRRIGFPTLIRLDATNKTMRFNGSAGIRGNKIDTESGHFHLAHVNFSERSSAMKAVEMDKALAKLRQGARSVYLMACPMVSCGHDADKDKWKNTRYVVNDVDSQMKPVPKEYALRIAQAKKLNQRAPI